MFPTNGCMQGWGWGRGAWGHWGRWGIKLALQLFLDPTSQPKMKEEEDNKLGSTVSLFRTYFQKIYFCCRRASVKAFENMKSAQTGDGGCQCVHKIWGSLAHWQLQILGPTCPSKPPNLRLIQVCWRLFHADSAPFFTSHVNAYTTPCDHLSAY